MKKIYLAVILLLVVVIGSYAQSAFGIKAGLNLASEYSRTDNQSATTDITPNFHVGGYYDAVVSSGFSVQSGLLLQGKGGKYKTYDGSALTNKRLYLEVPINLLGRVKAGAGDVFFGGGPYLAYGISAKVKSGQQAVDLDWGGGYDKLNPLDAGLNFLVGYRFVNGLVFNLGNGIGLENIYNSNTGTRRNRISSISVGYEFRKL
jgi:hypothetical protein